MECQEGDDHVEWLGWDLGRGGESWEDALEDDHDEVHYTEDQQRLLEGTATQAAEETVVDPGSTRMRHLTMTLTPTRTSRITMMSTRGWR